MAKILYGKMVLPNAQRTNQIYNRSLSLAANYGFTPYDAQGLLPHPPGSTVNTTEFSVTVCYTHPNPLFVEQAQNDILAYLEDRGWVSGDFGTWDDGLG